MKSRPVYITVATLLAASVLFLLGAVLVQNQTLSVYSPPAANAQGDFELIARRRISIPFGVDSVALLANDGQLVTVTGHGECEEGAETFRLRVKVTQGNNNAPAIGATTWSCANAGHWEVTAQTRPPFAFEEGTAEVCPMVIVQVGPGGNVVADQAHWGCQEVTLVSSSAVP